MAQSFAIGLRMRRKFSTKSNFMSVMLPPCRPRATSELISDVLLGKNPQKVIVHNPVVILGVRGYYRDTMGVPGQNDIGIYDDALFIHSPNITAAFNANTDPSIERPGMAHLCVGLWWYQIGIHGLSKPKNRQYQALIQAAPVTVNRTGGGAETGWFGINIHRGGYNTTSSEGCQTLYPDQYDAFLATVKDQLARFNLKSVPYLLIDGPIN